METSYSREGIHCFLYGGVQPWLIKYVMPLQNCTNSENVPVGPYGETFPARHDANQAMNMKAEEVSDAEKEEDPVPITARKIKAEPEVSCIFL
jgi:hypothetical protein